MKRKRKPLTLPQRELLINLLSVAAFGDPYARVAPHRRSTARRLHNFGLIVFDEEVMAARLTKLGTAIITH